MTGLRTSAGLLPAEAVVLAARKGPRGVAGAPRLRLERSCRPWLRLDAAADPDRPTRLLWTAGAWLLPRRDGTVVALGGPPSGAEPDRPSARVVSDLLAAVGKVVPASRGWGVGGSGAAREWRAPDGLPVLGEAGEDGLHLACGWAGEELLLAPAAAAVAADLVTGRVPPLALAPFSPARLAVP